MQINTIRVPRLMTLCAIAVAFACAGFLSGCHSAYSVPGSAADFRALGITDQQADDLTDVGFRERLERQPLAKFPAAVAVARLQGPSYCSYTSRGYGDGKYTLVTTRDVESPTAFDRLGSLPMVSGIAPLNRLVVPDRINTEK